RDFDAALAALPNMAARWPDDPVIALAHAEAVWAAGDPVAALRHFETALAHGAEGPRPRARYGLALLAAGRAVEALEQLERALAGLPGDASLDAAAHAFETPFAFAPAAADAALQLGQTLLGAGRLEPAIAALRHAAARDPAALPSVILGSALE